MSVSESNDKEKLNVELESEVLFSGNRYVFPLPKSLISSKVLCTGRIYKIRVMDQKEGKGDMNEKKRI